MKAKKLLALLVAALMLVGLVPAAAISEGAAPAGAGEAMRIGVAADKGGERAHENYFNNQYSGTYLNYTDAGSYDWVNKYDYDGEFYYLESGCAGYPFGTSVLTFPSCVRMYEGDYLEFQYWYSTEQPFDKFSFSVNGEKAIEVHGESGGWQTYRYEIAEEGLYNFEWAYTKDGSVDGGSDCVRLANCTYSGHYDDYRNRAGLVSGGGGLILNTPGDAEYGFWVRSSTVSGHEQYLMSSNANMAGSECRIEAVAFVPSDPGGAYTIEFDYAVSSETGYDFFNFDVDGTRLINESGTNDYTWKHYSHELSSGTHFFEWTYTKDGSSNQGEDVTCIDNIKIAGYDNTYDRYMGFEENGLAYNNNAQLIFNTPKGSEGFNTVTQGFLFSNNRFIDESVSYFEAYITMAQGETLSFNYLVSSEDYDFFRFIVDGSTKVYASGWEDPQLQSYTFTAPSTKTYLMRWEYDKDDSISRGYDLVFVLNILYNGSYLTDLTADDVNDMLNSQSTDVYLDFIGGAGQCGWFLPYISANGWDGAISANMYYENTESSIGTSCYMNAGDKLSFEFCVNGEEGCDFLEFRACRENGSNTELMGEEWWSISDNWETYTFTCVTPGTYWFGWDYKKDGSVNEGQDIAMIDNVCVERADLLMQALNPDGAPEDQWLWFDSTGQYYFEPVDFEGRFCARSNNHSGGTEAVLECAEMLGAVGGGSYLSFDYYVSCEATYDYLVFFVNDVEAARFSGTENEGWHTFVMPNKYSGWTEFKWVYHKDGNLSYGKDLAAIDNVKLTASLGVPGDANGDGTVNANDALLILRYSLGIVGAGGLNLANCDVNGDGNVNANDALLVLRAALGIITL